MREWRMTRFISRVNIHLGCAEKQLYNRLVPFLCCMREWCPTAFISRVYVDLGCAEKQLYNRLVPS